MNTDMNTANENGRSEIEDLLPWHAAGTLSAREAQSVEAALARDPELKRRYELVREELAQTIHLNETLGAPSARAMTELFAKIDAEPARHALSAASDLPAEAASAVDDDPVPGFIFARDPPEERLRVPARRS